MYKNICMEWEIFFYNRNQLETALSLDYEMIQAYTLILFTSDGVFNDTILLTVNVVDENDNSPIFVNGTTTYNFFISENEAPSTMIGNVKVRQTIAQWFYSIISKQA